MAGLYDHLEPDAVVLLRARAAQLADSGIVEDALEETLSVAVLQLRPERYGVPIQQVQEIEPLRAITPVPGLDRRWRGVVNLRGSMYAVLDLRRYLGLPDGEPSRAEQKIALLNGEAMQLGLLVDQVEEIRQIPVSQLAPPPRLPDGLRAEAIRGVTPDMLSVLDVDGLLSDPRLIIGQEEVRG